MKAKTVKEVLLAMRWILENKGWHRYCLFRNAVGSPISSSEIDIQTDQLASVCLLGANMLVEADPSLKSAAQQALYKLVKVDIAYYNDVVAKSKEEVFSLLDQAIEAVT